MTAKEKIKKEIEDCRSGIMILNTRLSVLEYEAERV
jgi:hypothetical protein|tara:strand:- start:760 stop:867 length:108 start_codon:yes stop_codon:yes gene_type:complete